MDNQELIALQIDAMGMHAENLQRYAEEKSPAYSEKDFSEISKKIRDAIAEEKRKKCDENHTFAK